ncbi:MAG: class I SAM-dependent methyltransferase [Chloroflexota bacterium]
MTLSTPTYQQTRQAWRDIWSGTEFDRELTALGYKRYQEVLNTYLPYLDKSIPTLEAGCGPGQVVYYLRQQGYNTVGLDYAPEALKPTLIRFPTLPLHMGDVHHLPYPTDTFGGYLSFGVVEHFEHGPTLALAEAYRVLRPGGKLVLTVPHPQIVEDLYKLVNRLFPSRQNRLGPRAEYYERTYSHQELTAIVQQVGFDITLVKPVGHSYTFYGLHRFFRRADGYYDTSPLAEFAATLTRRVLPWSTAFANMIIAEKPHK